MEFDNIPIVILSGTRVPGEEDRARALGADSYDVKPSSFNDLVRIVEDWAAQCPHLIPEALKLAA